MILYFVRVIRIGVRPQNPAMHFRRWPCNTVRLRLGFRLSFGLRIGLRLRFGFGSRLRLGLA